MSRRLFAWYLIVAGLVLGPASHAAAQDPPTHYTDLIETRVSAGAPDLQYTLRVDPTDLSGYSIEIRIRNVPDTLRLAMVSHPEYDDRFYRQVEDLSATAKDGHRIAIVREDSAVWRVATTGGESLIRYRIHLPAARSPRRGWIPFLSPTGGLVGGYHSFMYLVGATLAPARVRLDLPDGWTVATGLEATADPHLFFAPSAFVLADSPMLVGRLRSWNFEVQGVPHRVVYWPLPDATPFDSVALVDGIARIARQAISLFRRAPYREYSFLLQDGAIGALEHLNSVAVGAPSRTLSADLRPVLGEISHEFFHTWNLMRIRPAEYGDLTYRTPPRAHGLWWSEGITMYYADLLPRRAGLPGFEPTRRAHLQQILARYAANPGYGRFSAESVSAVAYGARPGALGDDALSTHLQGEVLGTMLDFIIRGATDGRRSLDDVLRLLLARFSGRAGFTGDGIEKAVHEVCGCPVHDFFERYVRRARAVEVEPYLRLVGLRLDLTWQPTVDDSGRAVPDLRIYPYDAEGDRSVRIILSSPDGIWGRAGLHTADRVLSLNGAAVDSAASFRDLRNRLQIGDTARVEISRPAGSTVITVVIRGYNRPVVRLEDLPDAPEKARRLRAMWETGTPERDTSGSEASASKGT